MRKNVLNMPKCDSPAFPLRIVENVMFLGVILATVEND